MIKYPDDNFYQGYSLGYDLNRSGKDEFQIVQKKLEEIRIKPTPKITELSLELIQLIHKSIRKYGKNETENYLKHLNKKGITGAVIPIDISLAYHSFAHLMQRFDPYVTAEIVAGNGLWAIKKIIARIKSGKEKDPLDKETKKIVEKIVKNETKKLFEKISELQEEVKRSKEKTKRKTINKKTTPKKKTIRKRK